MSGVSAQERAVGIETYASSGPPCDAKAKVSPEDFRVEELFSLEGVTMEARPDYYPVYRVEKRSIDTIHMERELSEALKSRIRYFGLKDKRAVAVQFATPTSLRAERPKTVVREKFTAQLVGFVPRPPTRGSVSGNRFELVLRECCSAIVDRVEDVFELGKGRRLPNFYGLQRFGKSVSGNHLLGKMLVRRDFRRVVELLVESTTRGGLGEWTAREMPVTGGHEEALMNMPPGTDFERAVARRLSRAPGDWIGALRAVPVRLRRLYTAAYQSYIFNRTLSAAMAKGLDISRCETGDNWSETDGDGLVPTPVHSAKEASQAGAFPMIQLAGYAYRDYGSRYDSCLEEVMEAEGVTAKDFYVHEMQEVSVEGGFRRAHLAVKDASFDASRDRTILRFTLARGQYATVLLREIIKPADPMKSGLA